MIESLAPIGLTTLAVFLAFRLGCRVGKQSAAAMPFEILRYFKSSADDILRQSLGNTEVEFNLHIGLEAIECTSKTEVAQVSLAIGEILSRIKPASQVSSRKAA